MITKNNSNWETQCFHNIFDAVYASLEKRKQTDASFTIEELEKQLENLYLLDGHDWLGRGKVADLDMEASIAALQEFLYRWKKAQEKNYP